MKSYIIWCQMLLKRLLRKPLFLLTLLLIPASVLLLRSSMQTNDAAVQILLCTQGEQDSLAEQTLQNLLSSSSNLISFIRCENPAILQEEILAGRADCGYVIPGQLEKALIEYEENGTPAIDSYFQKGTISASLMQEYMYGTVYDRLCFSILDSYIEKHTKKEATKELEKFYETYKFDTAFFTFSYADGTKNEMLSNPSVNYMLLPVRGLAAIFVLLSSLTGVLFWYEDNGNKLFCWLSKKKQSTITLLYFSLPCFLAGLVALVSIFLTDIFSSLGNELLCMVLFLCSTVGFCMLLKNILPSLLTFIATIPLIIGGSFVFSPVFLHLGDKNLICKILEKLSPVSYYLESIHSNTGKWQCLFFGLLLLFLSALLSFLRRLR